MQEVSGLYTSPFLYTDGLKMALRARKVSGAFKKRSPRVPGPGRYPGRWTGYGFWASLS